MTFFLLSAYFWVSLVIFLTSSLYGSLVFGCHPQTYGPSVHASKAQLDIRSELQVPKVNSL